MPRTSFDSEFAGKFPSEFDRCSGFHFWYVNKRSSCAVELESDYPHNQDRWLIGPGVNFQPNAKTSNGLAENGATDETLSHFGIFDACTEHAWQLISLPS